VIGAGRMARRRLDVLVATGGVRLCGVAARRHDTAARLAGLFGGAPAFDDYRRLAEVHPEAVLIEVPHNVQDGATLWAIDQGCHVLLGGPLATSLATGRRIDEAARMRGLVVEAGFEARYASVWEEARRIIEDGRLGVLTAGQAIALWPADPAGWYYDEAASGGMPLTHMSYCFVNPLRWLFGEPRVLAASAHRRVGAEAGHVVEETCVTLLRFGDLPLSLTASYVRAAEQGSWQVRLFGDRAVLDVCPGEDGPGHLAIHRGTAMERIDFMAGPDAFEGQARRFLAAVGGDDHLRNRPEDCLGDLRTVEAIRDAARPAGGDRFAARMVGR